MANRYQVICHEFHYDFFSLPVKRITKGLVSGLMYKVFQRRKINRTASLTLGLHSSFFDGEKRGIVFIAVKPLKRIKAIKARVET